MSALFHTYLLAKVRKHIDHSTECLTLFLDECDKSLDENQLSGLKALALYYRERSEEVQHFTGSIKQGYGRNGKLPVYNL